MAKNASFSGLKSITFDTACRYCSICCSSEDFPGNFDGPKAIIPDDEITAKFMENKIIKALKEAFG